MIKVTLVIRIEDNFSTTKVIWPYIYIYDWFNGNVSAMKQVLETWV